MRTKHRRLRGGFTLIELSIVLLIIGILMTFILAATFEATARAEQRATQALITKLETAVIDRMDAIAKLQPTVTGAHRFLGAIYPSGYPVAGPLQWGIPSDERAYVIAMFDMVKAEMPDVFYVQDPTATTGYPLNFAGAPYPNGGTGSPDFTLPIGNASRLYAYLQSDAVGPLNGPGGGLIYPTTGMYGASFSAAAGIYKQLGYLPEGYDGIDNNGVNGIDEFAEGIGNNPSVPDPNNPGGTIPLQTLILNRIANHDHKTARSEMLYALLVEGLGPMGSAFTADDFTEREVKDTDGDGLMEFVDAWGEPLQFYRWPIHYTSGIQLGINSYPSGDPFYPREQDPLDPNQTLMSPGWWAGAFNSSTVAPGTADGSESGNAFLFENMFHRLVDPTGATPEPAGTYTWWDRGGSLPRRAYFSKFLISSGGPDRQQGIARLGVDYGTGDPVVPVAGNPGGVYSNFAISGSTIGNVANLILIENTAARITPVRNADEYLSPVNANITALLYDYSADDITNQKMQTAGGGVQ
jgi:prepilin-type N-terminal cleavage/methylation domain-containing protein